MNKEELVKYLKEKEIDIQQAKTSIFAMDFVFRFYVESDTFHGCIFSPILCHIIGTNYTQIMDKDLVSNIFRKIYKEYLKDPKTLDEKIKRHVEARKDLQRLWEQLKKQGKITNQQILKNYDRIDEIAKEWWKLAVCGEDKGRIIDEKVVPIIQKNHDLSRRKAHEIVMILSHPEEEAIFTKERKDFFNICLYVLSNKKLLEAIKSKNIEEIKKNQEFMKQFSNYKKKYFFKNTDFYEKIDITIESFTKEIIEEIKKHDEETLKKDIEKIENEKNNIMKKKKEIISKIKLTEEDKNNIKFAKKIIDWQDERKYGMMIFMHCLYEIFDDIVKRIGLKYEDAVSLLVKELRDILSGKLKPDYKEIKKRQKGIILMYEKGKEPTIYYGKDAEEILKAGKQTSHKELKGIVASKGKEKTVKGKVRIVMDTKRDPFEKGEILVTSMTRIEFVPLMKKAKAIITDEGGIACHAAIVSRELGVPCIIGTKTATDILKNGDQIELDLETGVIKK
jgi:phosphoenolpyruvate synthase/pyruvate phosphate dikinase